MPSPSPNASSIPIPRDLVQERPFHAPGAPVADYRDVIEVADLPKLYAHWAEGRVEAVAEALTRATGHSVVGHDERRMARAALGLED